jgi:AcrR family transcriptional regulator
VTTVRPQLPPEFVAAHKRRRMIDAMSELCAEQGYEATKIADVVRRAHVARKTLYDNFAGKEELFLAAFDTTLADADQAVTGACEAAATDDWAARTEAGLRAVLEFVAANPAAARLCLVEAPAATRASAKRYNATIESYISRLRREAPPTPSRPATLEEALIGGAAWIVQRQIRRGDAADAVDLLPELTEFVTSPYRSVGKR